MEFLMSIYMAWVTMFGHLYAIFTSGAFAILCFAIAGILAAAVGFMAYLDRHNSYVDDFVGALIFIFLFFGSLAAGGWFFV